MTTESDSLPDNETYPPSAEATEASDIDRRNFIAGATLLGAAATIAAPAVLAQTGQTKRLTLSYYPWIKQRISEADLAAAVDKFARVLEAGLGGGYKVDRPEVFEIPDQLAKLKEKPTGDIAGRIGLLNPIGYALAHRDAAEVQAIAVIRRKIGDNPPGPTYKAQLYARKDSQIKSLKEVKGRSIGYGSAQSTSNFLVPALMLWEAGVHPLAGATRAVFTGGHDKAAEAVYKKELEVGAGHDGAIINLAHDPNKPEFKDALDVLQTIQWSDDIPSDPVAINATDPAVAKLVRDTLIKIATPGQPDSEGNKAVAGFWDTKEGFDAIAPGAYAGLLRMMYPIGLRADDMLRKT